ARSRPRACGPRNAGSTRGPSHRRTARPRARTCRGPLPRACQDTSMSSAAGDGPATSTATTPRAQRPRRDDMVELRIEGVAHGGAGVGRMDRYVVFVEGAFPGELVRA